MNTIIKDGVELGKLTLLPYFETFSRFDDSGKIGFLRCVFRRYANPEDRPNMTEKENKFCEGLKKALGVSGIMAVLSTVEGSRTYSWQRGFSIIDITRETDKILNKRHEGNPETALTTNIEYYQTIKEQYD